MSQLCVSGEGQRLAVVPFVGNLNFGDLEGDYLRGARESVAEGFMTSRESVQMSFLRAA